MASVYGIFDVVVASSANAAGFTFIIKAPES
jgi:hypothetical protein